jgi:polar amino acid transport system ATP-binding protein
MRHPEKVIARHRAMTGMAFQQFNLFPHLTALQNVTLGLLKVKKMHKDEAVALAEKWLERVGLLERRNHFLAVVRRSAAARGDCPGDCDEPEPDAVRRSHLGPGPGTGRRSAERDQGPGRRRHDHAGDPRNAFRLEVSDKIVFMNQGRIEEQGPRRNCSNARNRRVWLEFSRARGFKHSLNQEKHP